MLFKPRPKYLFLTCVLVIFGLLGVASLTLAQDDSWTPKTDMPTARLGLATAVVNGKIYAIGGYGAANLPGLSTVEEYDPATNTWTTKTDMPTGRRWLSASAVDGKIYAIGGHVDVGEPAISTVEEYEPATNRWTIKADMPTARLALATSAVNGKIYAIGGDTGSGGGLLATVEAYDPATNTWTKKADMPTARATLFTSAVDGKIYAIGGGTPGTEGLTTVEEYDPTTDIWTTKADMPKARLFLTGSVVNGMVYAIGGHSTEEGSYEVFRSTQEYNPVTDTWTTRAPMPSKRSGLSASAVTGKIYAFGGSQTQVPQGIALTEEYTPPMATSVQEAPGEQNIPTEFVLHQNYPNPFNPETKIRYKIPKLNKVVLKVMNLLGQEVRTLVDEEKPTGVYEVMWDGKDNHGQRVATGVYLYKLETRGFVQTRKMVLLQ
ncbi:MAG: kelch repeat-containing protein [bacterium]